MTHAVTFDLWNTLIRERHHSRAANRLAVDMSRSLAVAGYKIEEKCLGEIIEECRQMVMSRQVDEGLDMLPEEQLAWILGRAGLVPMGRVVGELLQYYTSARDGLRIEPLQDGNTVLAYLARRYRLALICNTGRTPGRVIRPWLSDLGLEQYFQVLTFSNELGIAKPNPDVFRRTLKELGVAPDKAAHIGDDPRTDVRGAESSGMIPIWFNPARREDGPVGVHQVERLSDLPSLLASVWGK